MAYVDSRRAQELSLVFKAFSDPIRIRLYQRLQAGACSVSQLCEELGLAQSRVSMHLRILRKAGFVRTQQEGKYRIYRRRLAAVCDLLAQAQAAADALAAKPLARAA